MKNILKIVAVAAVAVAITSTVQAVPITGVIGFSGSAQLDGTTVGSSTEVLSWGADNKVGIGANGAFTGLATALVALHSPWFFNSGAINDFWNVGGFQFDLASSSVFQNAGGFLSIVLAGTVSGNSYSPTAFTGRVTIQDPSSINGNVFTYTESLSFNPVPDGGTTVLLLGSALSGLALIRRKLTA